MNMTNTCCDESELTVLTAPPDGISQIVTSKEQLQTVCAQLSSGTSPVAIDTERANGFKYGNSAYLIQIKSPETGIVLLDPIPFGVPADFNCVGQALAHREWILHAAVQDLPCLVEAGMVPTKLFDTELAGRLLNIPKVGLASQMEREFQVRLLKEHSAANWSARPLSDEMINYAALDVEFLIPLRDKMAAHLEACNKLEWALQEFEHLVAHATDTPAPKVDPWQHTSGIHKVKSRGQLSVVKHLWQAREDVAKKLNRPPFRVLPDAAIIACALRVDKQTNYWPGLEDLRGIKDFQLRTAKRFESRWLNALAKSKNRALWPKHHNSGLANINNPNTWKRNHETAYNRWKDVQAVQTQLALYYDLPPENLLTPAILRPLAWDPPQLVSVHTVAKYLTQAGARPWQVELTAPHLARALVE